MADKFLAVDDSLVDINEKKSARGNNKTAYKSASDIMKSTSSYDNSISGLSSDTIQGAIDEIKTNIGAVVGADGSIDTHSDVDTTSSAPNPDDVLKWSGSNWVPGLVTTAVDVCGIDDGAGGYTYYSSIGAAITAASSGDTIEVFSNITETGANEILLKDGVDINFNGHQYTLNVATTQDAVTDNNSAVTCTLYNGHIKRTGGTASVSNSLALFIDNSASNITLNGMTFETDFGCVCTSHGTITGGLFLGNRTTSAYRGLYDTSTARWHNITMRSVYGEFECRGKVYDSYIYSSSDKAAETINGEFNNCTIVSDGNFALTVQGGNVNKCYILSSANRAVSRVSGITYLNNCYIKSSGGFCVVGGANSGIFASNCYIESTTNNAVYQGAEFYNCYITSSADAATSQSQALFDSCSVVCTWANAAGHGIEVDSTSTTKIVNCYIEVASSSANCIGRVSGTPTIQYTNNIYGTTATTPVNASIVQGMTNTPDTYGNIQIG